MRIKGIGGSVENLLAMLLQIIELAAMQRPGEDAEDEQHQHGRHRYQEVQDVHVGQRARRNELRTTTSELVAMPSPAAHGGSQPTSANGTQAAL